MTELEKRTTELEEHKVRVDEQTDQLLNLALRMSTRTSGAGQGYATVDATSRIAPGGIFGDGQTSIYYRVDTGGIYVDAAGAQVDEYDSDNNIFKATFGSSFGSLSFGNVAQPGLSEAFVMNDLTVVGSLAGGGDLGAVDLAYLCIIPEPSSHLLALLGIIGLLHWRR